MKIAVAQTRPVKGAIESNILKHKKLVALATARNAGYIFFPELSLTGYEPALAEALAIDPRDSRLNDFQGISTNDNITIGVGMPTKSAKGVLITMIIFQPGLPRQTYSKQHLHPDEFPWFVKGNTQLYIENGPQKIAPGICYETSLPAHWANARNNGATVYVASVAKSAAGIERSVKIFSEMARDHSMTLLLSNSLGPCDNFISAGKSAIWNNKGQLLAQLDGQQEGILLLDTTTGKIIEETL